MAGASGVDALLSWLDADDADDKHQPAAAESSKPARKLPRFGEPRCTQELQCSLPVIYSRSEAEADELCAELRAVHARGELDCLGFDLEWKALMQTGAPPRPVATVQLCSRERCLVLQVSSMRGFPRQLAALLQDTSVPKAGVGILNDGLKLRRDFGLRCDGLIDLAALAGAVLPRGNRPWSLADLCERVLRRVLPKDSRLRLSDWETRLDEEQLRYAALDAYCARALYIAMQTPAGASASDAGLQGPAATVAGPLRVPLGTISLAVPADPMAARRLPPAAASGIAQASLLPPLEPREEACGAPAGKRATASAEPSAAGGQTSAAAERAEVAGCSQGEPARAEGDSQATIVDEPREE